MGVVNATPDSFSGDGALSDVTDIQRAIEQALRMEDEGADIIDIGGESTRPPSLYPDAKPVAIEDEISRVVPIIERLTDRLSVPISIDTRKASVAAESIQAGAAMANDVSMLGDPLMAEVVASSGLPLVLSHIRPGGHRGDVVSEVIDDLSAAIGKLQNAGADRANIIIDPGIGFAKTAAQSVELLRSIARLRSEFNLPVLVGTSRKSFIGAVTGEPLESREFGTAATLAGSIERGADIVRVHDVKKMSIVAKMSDAIARGWNG